MKKKWINDLNGREEIFPGTNLFEWKHGDWISDIRLNAIHDNILRLNNIKIKSNWIWSQWIRQYKMR